VDKLRKFIEVKPLGPFWVKGGHVVYARDGSAPPELAPPTRWKEFKSFDPIVDLLGNPDLKHAFQRAWVSGYACVKRGLKAKRK